MMNRFRYSLIALFWVGVLGAEPEGLPSIAKMPDLPQPFVLRDWQKVARDFDRFVFDTKKSGKHLPLYWEESSRVANDIDGFGLPSYIGDTRQNPTSNAHEAITTMSAVLGGTLIGLDKSYYAEKLRSKFHEKDGIGLYLNHYSTTGDSFWYDLLPSLLFVQLYSHYPGLPDYRRQLTSTADVWRETLIKLGASKNSLPDFEHTGYDFLKKQPVDQSWKEPDAAAAIACIEYLSHIVTGNDQYLEAAKWAFDWMEQREQNPFYENLMPYGAYAAARSNAEQGTQYSTGKYIEWTLNGKNPRKWGSTLEKWNNTEVFGLIGSVYPDYEYAFTMNSFQSVGIIVPVARYEERYARDIAKWILNVAVNGRYFYPNAWPAEGQSSWEWAKNNDPDFCIPYEGIRKQGTTRDYPEQDEVIHGTQSRNNPETPEKEFTLTANENGDANYIGRLSIPPGSSHKLIALISHRTNWNGQSVKVSLAQQKNGPPVASLLFKADGSPNLKSTSFNQYGDLWIHIEAENLKPGAKIQVDDLLVETRFKNPPHVGGDPTVHGWGATDLGLYGGSCAAFLGAMVKPSNVEGIILIDPVATDMMPPKFYPTRLIFNPFDEIRTVKVNVGTNTQNLYDCLSDRVIQSGVSGSVEVDIPAKQAVMLVFLPESELIEREGKLLCNDIVVDYCYKRKRNE